MRGKDGMVSLGGVERDCKFGERELMAYDGLPRDASTELRCLDGIW